MLDFRSGDVHFAVVAFDTGWFQPDRLVTIPMDAFRRDERFPDPLVLDMTQPQVAQAPSFHPDRWPQFDQADFRGMWDRFLATTRGGTATGTGTATGVAPPAGRPLTAPAVGQPVPATTPGAGTGAASATPAPR